MKKIITLFIFCLIVISVFSDDCANGRYINQVFSRVQVHKNIVYARKIQSNGAPIYLRYDVYEPYGDTLAERPVMLLIHGGAYLKLLDQNSPDIVLMCDYFAKRGYVTVSIDYRQESNFLSILSAENMTKAVARALIDTRDAVDHLMRTYTTGNPYRIDTSRAFIGGVSAGAVSTLFISYLDSLQMLPTQMQQWIIEATGPESDSILRHRFDLVKPKAAISVSGALLDTGWLVNNNIDLLLIHGSLDNIVPYNYDYPLGVPMLPKLFGGKALYPVAQRRGIRTEFEDWIGYGHVPFMNLDLGSIITLHLIAPDRLDSTERHIAHFIYRHLGCNLVSGVRTNLHAERLSVYPNPATDYFNLPLPKDVSVNAWQLEIYSLDGKLQVAKEVNSNVGNIRIDELHQSGTYIIKLSAVKNKEEHVYMGEVQVLK